jgi:hypothetical protein
VQLMRRSDADSKPSFSFFDDLFLRCFFAFLYNPKKKNFLLSLTPLFEFLINSALSLAATAELIGSTQSGWLTRLELSRTLASLSGPSLHHFHFEKK